MDHQSTVIPSGLLADEPAVAGDVPVGSFDQIIFTSVGGSQGYQIVSASRSVTLEEKRVFGMWSPSHRGLSRETSHAVGASFYPLPTGRFCVSRSWHAGMEPSGRGGLRVYTLGLIFDEETLATFSFNPLAILRALGKVSPELRPTPHLPTRELSPKDGSETLTAITQCCNEVDVEWLSHLLDDALEGNRLVVRCKRAPLDIVETILTALPGPMRASLSFCSGLKFSLGRQVRWTLSDAPQPNLSRVLRGQGLGFVDLVGAFERPAASQQIWTKMAELSWRNRAVEDLLWLNEGSAAPQNPDRLAGSAEMMMRVLTARITDFDGLLALAADAADTCPATNDEHAIRARFWNVLDKRLEAEVRRGGPLLLEHRSGEMLRLLLHHPVLLKRLGPLTMNMLTRCALEDPLSAGQMALRWLKIPGTRKMTDWTDRLQEEIFEPLGQCVDDADDDLRFELKKLLSRWAEAAGKPVAASPGEESEAT